MTSVFLKLARSEIEPRQEVKVLETQQHFLKPSKLDKQSPREHETQIAAQPAALVFADEGTSWEEEFVLFKKMFGRDHRKESKIGWNKLAVQLMNNRILARDRQRR